MKKFEKIMSEPEYRKLSNLSYSKLAGVDRSPSNLKQDGVEMTPALIYGSAVDVLAFDGKEEFEKKFATISTRKPGFKAMPIIDELYKELENNLDPLDDSVIIPDLSFYEERLLELGKLHEYGGKNWGDDAIIRNLMKECADYFQSIVLNRGKLILDPEQFEFVKNSVNTLYTHPFTSKYFDREQEGIDIYFQFPIVWEYYDESIDKTIDCKSLLDILLVDHNQKKLYPIDLKTTGKSVMYFPYSFIDWNYYLQASFYTDAVHYLKDKLYPEYFDYEVETFKFVVISSKNPVKPLVYNTTAMVIESGRNGGFLKTKSYHNEVKGYKELVRNMYWHIEKDNYMYPKEVYDKNGELTLDVLEC